jgi:MarR family transcriptional regulator, temperature-dependent positive regulator of motility
MKVLGGSALRRKQGRRVLHGIKPAVETAQRAMLRGLADDEAQELMRLLRKAITAGNELSRAPLRAVPAATAKKG